MKGIYKGFRFFSQIFDGKEQEMQIGFPTDVKHVAHIGWDGPSVTPPIWMNEFKSAPLGTFGSEPMGDVGGSNFPSHSHDLSLTRGLMESHTQEHADPAPIPKPSRRKQSITESPLQDATVGDNSESQASKPPRRHTSSGTLSVDPSSPDHELNSKPRHSRRNKSIEAALVDTNGSDLVEGSTRRGRRTGRIKESSNESDLPAIPKQTKKKKKSKNGSSGDASSINSKTSESVTEPREESGYIDPTTTDEVKVSNLI